MDRYLTILIDSLKKKNTILDEIQKICDKQDLAISDEKFSLEEYNELMVRKGELIKAMNRLDDGFTALYERISPELKKSPVDYTDSIRTLQSQIKVISDKIALIQAKELRIQSRIDRMVEITHGSKDRHVPISDAAKKYSQTMKGTVVTPSIFVDSKRKVGRHDT